LILAGCSVTNPATIATPFDAAEGRNAQLGGEPGNGGSDGNFQGNGGVKLRNFLVVSEGGNQPGVVVGVISNDTGQPAQLTLTLGNAGASGQTTPLGSTTVTVPPGGVVQLGNPLAASGSAGPSGSATAVPTAGSSAPGQVWFQVSNVSQPAGSFLQLVARDPQLGSVNMNLPIQLPLDEYASLTPTPPAPSATATGSPTGSPQPTPSASGSARPSS
jgi:hypothetical protein